MSGERNIPLFSYGTLQLESVQLASFGRLLSGHHDAMLGYRKEMLEITSPEGLRESGAKFHPIVMPSSNPSDAVEGMVFEITADELAAADRYEVSDYKRVEAPLKVYVKA